MSTIGNIEEAIAITSGQAWSPDLLELDSNRFLAAWGQSDGVQVKVGNLEGSTVTWGSEYSLSSEWGYVSMCLIDTDKVAILFGKSSSNTENLIVGTISGDTISWGSPVVVNSSGDCEYKSIIAMDASTVVLAYDAGEYYPYIRMASISGTTITLGSASQDNGNVPLWTQLFKLDTTHFLYGIYNSATGLEFFIGTWSGGTSFSLGSANVVPNTAYGTAWQRSRCDADVLDSTHVIVSWPDSSTSGACVVGTINISGGSISWGTQETLDLIGSNEKPDYVSVSSINDESAAIFYKNEGTGSLEMTIANVVGTTISLESPMVVDSGVSFFKQPRSISIFEAAKVFVSIYNGSSGVGEMVVVGVLDSGADSEPPVITLLSHPSTSIKTGYTQITLSGTLEDDSAIGSVTWTSATASGSATVDEYDWVTPAIDLVTGTNTIQIKAADVVSNEGFKNIGINCIPGSNTTRYVYGINNLRNNVRGAAADGFVRPTLKQFFTSTPDFEEINSITGGVGAPFVDASSYSGEVTLNGSAANSADSPFTNGTISRSYGSGQFDIVPDNAGYDTIGTGDFTIELWVNPAVGSGTHILLKKGNLNQYNTTTWFQLFQNSSGISMYITDSGGSQVYVFPYRGGYLNSDTWYHFAIVRISGNIYVYVDGVQIGTAVSNTQDITGGTDTLKIGSGATYTWSGKIALVRITKDAKYTTGFTPSTNILDYDSDANTLVLFRETLG